MEVHHHTHTPRKKILHFIQEFLMLFLAVFCGFYAEYQLEHKIEKDREKQFMKSLLIDLQKDSSFLSYNIKTGPRIIRFSDSVLNELRTKPARGNEKRLYHFSSLLSEGLNFRYYDRTISQLRNSGSFRLVQKINVSNSMLDYDVIMREAVAYNSSPESWSLISPGLVHGSDVFNYDIIFSIYEDARKYENSTDSIRFPSGLQLLSYDEKEIKKYIGLQRLAQITDEQKLNYSQRAYRLNRKLDSLVRAEYNLK